MLWGDPSRFSIEYRPHEDPEFTPFSTYGRIFLNVAGERREVGSNEVITDVWHPFEAIATGERSIDSEEAFAMSGTKLLRFAYRGVYAWPNAWKADAWKRGYEESRRWSTHVLYIGGPSLARGWFLVAATHGRQTRVALADMRDGFSRHNRCLPYSRRLIRPGYFVVVPASEFLNVVHAFADFGAMHPWWDGHQPSRNASLPPPTDAV